MTPLPRRPFKALLALTISAVVLSACMSTLPARYDDGPTEEGKLFADYLAGKYAQKIEDAPASAAYLSRAFSRAPGNASVGANAIRAAITNGDETLARTLAIEMDTLAPSEPLTRIVLSARDMKAGKYAEAADRLSLQPDDPTLGVLIAMMEAWAEYGAGQTDEALEIFQSIETGGYFDIIAAQQTAIIYGELGEHEKAEKAFALVESTGLTPILTSLAHARYLSSKGDNDKALAVLTAFSERQGGIETGPIRTAMTRLESGQALETKMSAAQHAANSVIDPAGAFFAQQRLYESAELYLRTALMMDPDNQHARVWLANVLERQERDSEAKDVYRDVPLSSDYTVSAQLSLANLLFQNKQREEAIERLRVLNETQSTSRTREALGRLYLIEENYEKALPFYDRLVGTLSDEDIKSDPTPLYFRGICLAELDRWEEAVADFRKVLSINPDNAEVLNYLGYTWVDRGENLTEAFEMIRRAVELEPDSGAIIDSLGWAHYKLGQYSEAVIHLEDAVAKDPDSATIIDHLGDVYWKLGRYREAGFQWQRALEFDPTDEERAAIEQKLKGGLSAVTTAP